MTNLAYESVDYVNHILNTQKYNGRVNIVEPEDPFVRFKMHERIANKNKASNYMWRPKRCASSH